MSDDQGFSVRDRRRVKMDGAVADTEDKMQSAADPTERPEIQPQPERQGGRRQVLPPVDFAGFVLGLGQMALMHLGDIPEPSTRQIARNLEQARHTIDILDMLEEKTRGNLTPEESNLLRALKSELKLKYVKAANEEKTG